MIKRILRKIKSGKGSKENKESKESKGSKGSKGSNECSGIKEVTGGKGTPLPLIKPGKKAKISHLETKDLKVLQKLMAMGVLPGMPVTLIRKSPSYVFELDQTRYAVDRNIAAHIYVSY
ncbi:MAG: FeoA family protein [Methanosarcinaceae archaeon]|nr:FeoA family protein [Methanosarcinaceae archaeon]MDD4497180.1 FeoA family protein [Methanosarcinaceae archaeon]